MLNELTKNLPDGVREAVGAGLAAGLGAVTGGGAGAATAFNADTNNRQLHQDSNQNEVARLKEMANGDPQREADLVASACALVKCSAEYPDGSDEKNIGRQSRLRGTNPSVRKIETGSSRSRKRRMATQQAVCGRKTNIYLHMMEWTLSVIGPRKTK